MAEQATLPERQPRGQKFTVEYKDVAGDDFRFVPQGEGILTATGKEYATRLAYVKPGGVMERAGARVGDELEYVFKKTALTSGDETVYKLYPDFPGLLSEVKLRQEKDVDAAVKKVIDSTDWRGEPVNAGAILTMKARGVAQPGEDAPGFRMPCVFPLKGNPVGECSLAQAIGDGKKAVIFFRPGIRFSRGDFTVLKLLNRLKPQFDELGVNIAVVSSDKEGKAQKQAKAYGVTYPMIIDENYAVADAYGAIKELDNIGSSTDRNTFIVSSDGKIERTYAGIGWDPSKRRLAGHLADVIAALGGDRQKAYETAFPKEMTVGDAVDLTKKAFNKITS